MDGYGLGSVYGWLWSRKCIWMSMVLEVYIDGHGLGMYMDGYGLGSVYGCLWSRKCIWMAMV